MPQRSFSCAQHRSTTVTLLAHGFGLNDFTQLPQNYRCCLAAMSLISQACRASPFKSVQIKPSPLIQIQSIVMKTLIQIESI